MFDDHTEGMIINMADYKLEAHGQFTAALTWSFGCRMTSSSSLSAIATLWDTGVTTLWTDATNGLNQFYPTTTSLQETRVAELGPTMHEIQNIVTPNVSAGLSSVDTLPFQESIVVSQRAAGSTKWDRGRMYLPAMIETVVNNDIVDSTDGAKIQAAFNTLFADLTTAGNTIFVTSLRAHKDGTGQYAKQTIVKWKVAKKPARMTRRVKKVPASYFA